LRFIIDFKWDTYTKSFFFIQFLKTVFFIACFVADIVIISYTEDDLEDDSQLIGNIVIRALCTLYMLDFLFYELRQMWYQTFEVYVTKDFWNICDFLLFSLYTCYLPISFIYDNQDYLVKCLQCAIIMFTSIKLNFYLRIFDQFSYLVQMVQTVLYDIGPFIMFFVFILCTFAVQVSLITGPEDEHQGIGPVKYFVMVLRTALGDNDMSQDNTDYKILFWIIWLFVVFIGNIMLMNFIIAVVGDSYANCKESMTAQSYKAKVEMIIERETVMSKALMVRKEAMWFPRYIVIRKPVDRRRRRRTQGPTA
jgi:phosphate/sulfate permease